MDETTNHFLLFVSVVLVIPLVILSVVQLINGYGLSYNYFDEMAQSYCASNSHGFTFALRRDCGGRAPTCQNICKNAASSLLASIGNQRRNVACYDAFNIRKNHPLLAINPSHAQPDAGKLNMVTYGYGSGGCTWTPNHCGPNYCCCKAF